jgi:hypothetical protein
MKERKELACGETHLDAIRAYQETGRAFNPDAQETVFDKQTSLWSVYNKRKPKRETWRPVTRVARAPYTNGYGKDKRPVVVTLLPRELIETRLKGTRRRYSITWDDLHALLVRRHALNVMRTRQAERAAKRKARKAARKGGRK